MKSVVLIGDSIRLGYQATVIKALARRATIYSPIDNGGTSANVLAHVQEWAIDRQPDVIHFNCGLHDLAWERDAQTTRIAVAEYAANLRKLVRRLQTGTKATLIWASTTPVNEDWHHANKPFERHAAHVAGYNYAAAQVMAAAGVPVNDLYAVVMAAGRDTLLCPDGVHYLPPGCELLGRAVATAILSHL